MKKLFIRLSMILFVLGMSTTAWGSGIMDLAEQMGQEELVEQVQAILAKDPVYHAQLTGLASSTGGGVVYATTTSGDPRGPEYEPGVSNVAVNGTNLAMRGATDFPVYIFAWAKPAAGYYFLGWSYSDGGTELVSEKIPNPDYNSEDPESEEMIMPHKEEFVSAYDVATTQGDTLFYTIYATFEPYRFAGYTISGSTTTANQIANLTVVCSIMGEDPEGSDFDALEIVDETGGKWVAGDTTLNTAAGTLTIPVTFTADNTNPGEFTATLKVKTMAGLTLNVPLNARTVSSASVQAIRYNKSKVQQEAGDLTDLLSYAATDDIIKLNGNYSDAVSINKSITFDLNGYTLSNTLTVGGGNVTLAYSPFGGTISDNVSVTAGKLILTGGTINGNVNVSAGATLEQNGASITGNVTNKGTMTTTDGSIIGSLTSSGTLTINGGTFTNNSGVAIDITGGGKAQIKKGTITGKTYGVQTTGGSATATIEKLAVIYGKTKALNREGGSLVVNSGKFLCPDSLANGTIEFQSAYFQKKKGAVDGEVHGKKLWRNTSGAEYREGYEFFAGDLAAAQVAGVSVCHIGSTSYPKLEDALAYANNTTEQVVIIMDNDYTLPGGYYTLPANATLLIPYNDDQGSPTAIVDRINMTEHDYVTPSEFRTLTLATGVNLDVFGTIEVSGRQFSCGTTYTGAAYGPYGHLHLNKGSKIVLQNASLLRAWGFVTSGNSLETSGEIDVRRGGKVYELFQMGDWGEALEAGSGLLGGSEVFPLNTYFIQNVEVPTKYHPGAKLSSATTVCESAMNVTIMMSADDIQIIGVNYPGHPEQSDKAMFLMDDMADADNTWVRKWYNPTTDQQVYDINSGAHIGQLVIPLVSSPLFPKMGEYFNPEAGGMASMIGKVLSNVDIPESIVMNSGQYNLPITNNFKLHLLSGTLDFTQNTALLPGSEVEIDKESTLSITQMTGVNSGSLYVYDYRDWGQWAENDQYARRVKYAAYWHGEPTTRNVTDPELIGSAKINVHGAFDNQKGFVFTSEHGGNIFSSVEDAGTFIFTTQLTGEWGFDPAYEGDPEYYTINVAQKKSGNITCKPVWLKNEAVDDYVHAGAIAAEGYSYCYLDIDGTGGKWTKLEDMGCFTYDEVNDVYYIKPQEYVAVNDQENDDHTYSDAAGAGRLFILLTDENGGNCQWWEVEQKNNYYHCIHPENDTYYEWWDDPDEEEPQYGEWKEKKFSITWKDWNGTLIATYQVPYGTQAEWLSTNPTRPATVDYTYDFTGWSPALDKVTSDVTYTATYEEKQIKYTITFVQDGGMEIERHLLARNEMPVCENVPTRTGYILEWSPALAAVTGNQTYTATWLPVPPEEYAITFYDYNGTTKLKPTGEDPYMVAVGTVPTPPEKPTGKPATAEYTYVFDHWSPVLEEVSATSAKVYTAVYREVAREYTIYYFKEDGVTPNATKASESLPYGATPTPPTVSKEDPENGHTYTLVWKNLEETATIQTVTGNASYKPTYIDAINKYTVSVRSNPSGACTISGAGVYDYNTSATITLSVNSGYTFNGWSAGQGDLDTTITVTSDVNLVANFTYNGEGTKYTITWKNKAGNANLVDPVTQLENTATIYTGPTPTEVGDAQYSYVFDGWVTDTDYPEEGVFYKNNMTPKATKNATYYAHFAATPRKYTITWKNEAGTADIEVDYDQPYGTATAFNSATPTKQATAAATYTFDGWATEANGVKVYEIGATPTVGVDATYYAHFATDPRTYTITWLDENGGLIDQTTEEYSLENTPTHAKPTKAATAQYTYTFTDWNPALTVVTGTATYTAQFSSTVNKYDITWVDGNGETLKTEQVEYGQTPAYTGATPTKTATAQYSYAFNNTWSPAIVEVTEAATYTAQFDNTVNEYTITWVDGNGETLKTEQVAYGQTLAYTGATPTKTATAQYTYAFNNTWSPTITSVTGDATYTAQFGSTVNEYTITWVDGNGATLKTEQVAYGETPEYTGATPTKTATDQYTYTFNNTWSPAITSVTGAATYTAQFDNTVNTYTITWKNWDGTTLETDENVLYGTTPSYDGAEPTKAEDEQYTYTFDGWTPDVAEVAADAVYTAQFNAIPKVSNLEIGINETETLTEPTTRDNLVITSNGSISGELVGAEKLTLSGAAYFDLVLNAQSHVWYAVAVPWQVDAETGISVNGNTLTLGVDFDLLYYNGELRASQGVNQAWNYVENDANKTMQPGRLYMIGLMLDAPVIRFAKKSTAAILTTSTSVTEYASAVASDANWNGIANPALFHAYLNAGTEEGQIYDANAVGYNLITLNTHKLVVGQPVFVQAPHTKSVVVTYGGPFAAPSHAQTQENAKYEVQIASEEGASTDRLFIKIDEDKSEDTYVIGKDLAKMGVSSKVAQLWVNRYNAKLCVNTQAPVNGVAEYPLGIYVPVSGNYTISCQNAALSEHDALYLTYDGQVVANLTQSAYTITLNAGTDVHYALRVGTTSDDATGMDEIIVDAQGQTRKVLVNDHVFIIRGDKVYTIDGQLVK